MKHVFETKVYYADTDAYGVVWHGAYLRWLEKGRVELCDALGLDLIAMKNADVLLPVTNMNVRYKASAKLNDSIIIETWLEKCNSFSVTFKQKIYSAQQDKKLFIDAAFDVVAINSDGKLYRRMPEDLYEKLQKGIENLPTCAMV
jgi:acyl-CoA thioester hydrolase